MEDINNKLLAKMMKRQLPNMSHVKPPTESAATTMIRNLRAASGTKADNTPK
jgi:hypothetical protein